MLSAGDIKLIRSLSEKKFRDKTGLFVVEGEKMVDEALNSGYTVERVIRKDEIGEDKMRKISMLSSGSPVLAIVHKPSGLILNDKTSCQEVLGSDGLFLALDSIRDPGNLGTILRIADWFGIKAVFASSDTVDIFNPKVVQSTMGAIFRVRFHYANLQTLCDAVHDTGGTVSGTFLDGTDIYSSDLNDGSQTPSVIVIGNESEGISDQISALSDCRLLIPPFPSFARTSESLNAAVATAVTVAEFRRRYNH